MVEPLLTGPAGNYEAEEQNQEEQSYPEPNPVIQAGGHPGNKRSGSEVERVEVVAFFHGFSR